MTTTNRSSFPQQIAAAEQILKANPKATNAQLRTAVPQLLAHQGLSAPDGMSNGVFSSARRNLGIESKLGRPIGSKNKKTPATVAPKVDNDDARPAVTLRSTGIFSGNEVIHIGRPAAQIPTLDELLVPIGRMMRERGISRLELWDEGIRVTRQVSEELVF